MFVRLHRQRNLETWRHERSLRRGKRTTTIFGRIVRCVMSRSGIGGPQGCSVAVYDPQHRCVTQPLPALALYRESTTPSIIYEFFWKTISSFVIAMMVCFCLFAENKSWADVLYHITELGSLPGGNVGVKHSQLIPPERL